MHSSQVSKKKLIIFDAFLIFGIVWVSIEREKKRNQAEDKVGEERDEREPRVRLFDKVLNKIYTFKVGVLL